MKKLDNSGIKKILSVARGWNSDTARELEARVPSGGKDGQILMATADGAGRWTDIDILDLLSYGVSWKPNVADPVLTRIGNMSYHRTLPIQSGMKGCIYNPAEKKVVYWLDEDDWRYKEGGNPAKGQPEQLARLDGYDGEVMVYIPEFWIRSWHEPGYRAVRVSPVKIDDSWEYQPAIFLAAFFNTILNTVPENMGYLSTLEVNSAVSICNTEAYCRGGKNDSARDTDDEFRTDLGKGRCAVSKGNARTYARKGNKELLSYVQYKNIFYWLCVIEYANFNIQAPFNPDLTPDGFRQGGLGMGPYYRGGTTGKYYSIFPLCPNGYTNSLGSGSGVIPMTFDKGLTAEAHRWRGIETPYGHQYIHLDGCVIRLGTIYVTTDETKFSDQDISGMTPIYQNADENATSGYVKEWLLGSNAWIIPVEFGGSASTYKCDQGTLPSPSAEYFQMSIAGGSTDEIENSERGPGSIRHGSGYSQAYTSLSFRTICKA